MSDYLELTFLDDKSKHLEKVNDFEFRNKPFSNGNVYLASIEDFRLLTKGEDVKRIYDLKLSIKDDCFNFLPGDTIGILPQNDISEVDKLLIRLNVESQAECYYRLQVLETTVKKNPTLPKHIPHQGVLKDIFIYYIDIRKPPKKVFLKSLIQYTADPQEAKELEEICSPKGSKQYFDLITRCSQTLLGVLNTFPSCFPPIEIILEHSSPLQPRCFSISSSHLEKNVLHITFFVVENSDGTKGVCTGWLEEITKRNEVAKANIPFYFRKPNHFRIPLDLSVPLILIATGTGLAPFKGFLDHRLMSKSNGGCDLGDAILFYGCRYSDRDFLYQEKIEGYLKNGALSKLYVAFSRDGDSKCYVQDKVNEKGEDFVTYILNKNAIVYVCGNVKTTVKDIKEAVINNLIKHGNMDQSSAEGYLNELINSNHFNVDSWL